MTAWICLHRLRRLIWVNTLCRVNKVGFLVERLKWFITVLSIFLHRDLFHQPSSKDCSEITLRSHLKEEAVRQLVDFCYSSDITVDSQSADKILTAANFLQIKEVEKLCITFLAAQQALKSEVRLLLLFINPFPFIDAFWCLCNRRHFENIVAKGKITHIEQFFHLLKCFKPYFQSCEHYLKK